METQILQSKISTLRYNLRTLNEKDWINTYASGTLRKNSRLGMSYRSQYLHERVNWDFGDGFSILPRSRVTFGDAITESDCAPITEAGWYIDRYITINNASFPEEHYECKYIFAQETDSCQSEGIGIVIRQTYANWIPVGHIVYCIVTEYDKLTKQYRCAKNPM